MHACYAGVVDSRRDVTQRTRRCRCVQPEIKQILERLYGLRVKSVRTLNVEGKKKRGKHGYYRGVDYKKAYVTLEPPTASASH